MQLNLRKNETFRIVSLNQNLKALDAQINPLIHSILLNHGKGNPCYEATIRLKQLNSSIFLLSLLGIYMI